MSLQPHNSNNPYNLTNKTTNNVFFQSNTLLDAMFGWIGWLITSMGAVIFVMLMVIIAMIFFSHSLFLEALPGTMENWEKTAASWALALGWELTVLVTSVNAKHLNSRIPGLFAVCSGVVLLYFIHAFESNTTLLVATQRWFVGVLVASINYVYADLFTRKWAEYKDTLEAPLKLNELQSRLIALQSRVDQAESANKELIELKGFRLRVEKDLTCPHCSKVQTSYGTLHAHKGHCQENPKKKTIQNLTIAL